jgi:hypothetical protein
MYVERNIKGRSCNRCCNRKAINITYIALVIRHAHAHAPYFHLWPARLYPIFGKKSLNIKTVFRFSPAILSETFLIKRRMEREIM